MPTNGGGAGMSNAAKALIERALALSPQDRNVLVEDVLDSLDRIDPDIVGHGHGRQAVASQHTGAVSLPPKTSPILSPHTSRDDSVPSQLRRSNSAHLPSV